MTIFQIVLVVICLQCRSFAFTWQTISTNNGKKTRGTSLVSRANFRNAKAQVTGTVYAQNTKHSHPMPDGLPCLKHSYYLLRHGQSLANVEGTEDLVTFMLFLSCQTDCFCLPHHFQFTPPPSPHSQVLYHQIEVWHYLKNMALLSWVMNRDFNLPRNC